MAVEVVIDGVEEVEAAEIETEMVVVEVETGRTEEATIMATAAPTTRAEVVALPTVAAAEEEAALGAALAATAAPGIHPAKANRLEDLLPCWAAAQMTTAVEDPAAAAVHPALPGEIFSSVLCTLPVPQEVVGTILVGVETIVVHRGATTTTEGEANNNSHSSSSSVVLACMEGGEALSSPGAAGV